MLAITSLEESHLEVEMTVHSRQGHSNLNLPEALANDGTL